MPEARWQCSSGRGPERGCDHLDAITAALLAPPPQVFGGGSGPSPAVVPGLQLLIDVVALWLLLRPNVKRYYLDTTAPESII